MGAVVEVSMQTDISWVSAPAYYSYLTPRGRYLYTQPLKRTYFFTGKDYEIIGNLL